MPFELSDVMDLLRNLTPLQALAIIGGVAGLVYLLNRSKGSLILAMSAGVYALPMVVPMLTKMVR